MGRVVPPGRRGIPRNRPGRPRPADRPSRRRPGWSERCAERFPRTDRRPGCRSGKADRPGSGPVGRVGCKAGRPSLAESRSPGPPVRSARRTTVLMQAFNPGASPPPVSIPMVMAMVAASLVANRSVSNYRAWAGPGHRETFARWSRFRKPFSGEPAYWPGPVGEWVFHDSDRRGGVVAQGGLGQVGAVFDQDRPAALESGVFVENDRPAGGDLDRGGLVVADQAAGQIPVGVEERFGNALVVLIPVDDHFLAEVIGHQGRVEADPQDEAASLPIKELYRSGTSAVKVWDRPPKSASSNRVTVQPRGP